MRLFIFYLSCRDFEIGHISVQISCCHIQLLPHWPCSILTVPLRLVTELPASPSGLINVHPRTLDKRYFKTFLFGNNFKLTSKLRKKSKKHAQCLLTFTYFEPVLTCSRVCMCACVRACASLSNHLRMYVLIFSLNTSACISKNKGLLSRSHNSPVIDFRKITIDSLLSYTSVTFFPLAWDLFGIIYCI